MLQSCLYLQVSFKKERSPDEELHGHKLHDLCMKNNLQVILKERLHCVTAAEPEEQWQQMETVLQETMAEVVGLSTRKHQDWFDKADKEI